MPTTTDNEVSGTRSRAGAVQPVRKSRLGTKHHAVCERLTDLARELGADQKFPTFTQLRDQLGVSVVTLSTALDELEARKVLYRRPGVGIYVSPKFEQKSIALVCEPGFFQLVGTSPFWEILLEQTRQRADALNWDVCYHFSNTAPRDDSGEGATLHGSLLADLRAGRVHGVLSIGGGEAAHAMLEGASVPFVAYAGEGPHKVVMEPDGGVGTGAGLLADAGCRRIALWSPVMPYRVIGDPVADAARLVAGATTALRRRGLPFLPELAEHNHELIAASGDRRQTDLSLAEQGYRTAYRVFNRPASEWPDGVVSANDVFTQGVVAALRELGVGLNAGVRVASHANRGSSALLGAERDLYLFEVDPAEIVGAMFALLETQMSGATLATRDHVVVAHPRVGANVPGVGRGSET
jgi:DNA-binding LacI/PurR family transcriptional regulator